MTFSSIQSRPTPWDPMDCSMPGLPVHHQLLEVTQTHVHWVDDATQPSHPLSSPSPPTFNLSQHQALFKWVSSSHHFSYRINQSEQISKPKWISALVWSSGAKNWNTEDGDCSHEIKRHLLLARKAMMKVNSILKSRDITLPIKVQMVKAMILPAVMYRCESWIMKKAESQWIDVFKLCYWRTLESPLGSTEIKPVNPKGNQPWIFIGKTDAEAGGSNPLAIWCEEPTHLKRPWCWERLKAGQEEGDGGWDGWMASLTQWTWVWANTRRSEEQGNLEYCSLWGGKETWLSDLTTMIQLP